ncbi:uncharacterized protein LOC116301306, partial [Actinia tenebrosa]|uniref:Uncharacterized protein LOC116301306 n=1 Tax=Actinia tenebrosa TaxID=6105 RepID=A0A6P8IH78_ACTTE
MASLFALLLFLFQAVDLEGLTSWPGGKYGMLKPTTGCPEEWTKKNWKYTKVINWRYRNWYYMYMGWTDKGYVLQETKANYPNNTSSDILHIQGHVGPNSVLRYFCVKRTYVNWLSPIEWPQGRYCIHQNGNHHSVPRGIIYMLYDTDDNNNHVTQYVDDFIGYWGNSIKMWFSCQTSGDKKIPISLPITKPFYLLPYGSRDCQQVKWMVATTERIKYHTRNYKGHKQNGFGYETVPYHEIGDINDKGITMYYCYYKSCNYTLTDKKGVFQSPRFPGKYPDGQLCSWRIIVPDNHTLLVRFTNFSLHESAKPDNLTFLTFVDGSFHLNDTFHGHHNQPFTITATNDVLFEFLTNEEGHSTGFRAEYTVFKTPETTPSSPPSTTRNISQHTTLSTNTLTGLPTTKIPTTETGSDNNNSKADNLKPPETTPSPPSTTRNIGQHTTLNTNTGVLNTTKIPTTETGNDTNNSNADTLKPPETTPSPPSTTGNIGQHTTLNTNTVTGVPTTKIPTTETGNDT